MATKITKLSDDTFMLTDKFIRVNEFLLIGSERALLLDTGYGSGLKEKVKKLTSLPVTVANTHLHPDHSNGNRLFDEIFVGEADLPSKGMPSNDLAKAVATYYFINSRVPDAIIEKVLQYGLIRTGGEKYSPLLKSIDLGGRVIRTLPCPGHTPGCTLFLDEKNKWVFAGDTINPAFWAFTNPALTLIDYARVWMRLQPELEGYGKIFISHHSKPLDAGYVGAFIKNLLGMTLKDGKPSFIKGGTPQQVHIYKRRDEKYGNMAVWAYPSQVRKV